MLEQKDYCELFNDAIKRTETVVLGCKCRVKFSGRAESILDTGDRVVIVKEDGVLLVHQPTGNNPINYMKPGASQRMFLENKKIFLKAENLELKEKIIIEIDRIYFLNSHKLEDSQDVVVMGTEDDMAKMIYENPSIVEQGLKQVSQEEQTKYGFIDVLCVDKDNILTVIECKRYQADFNAVMQLERYIQKLKESKGINNIRGFIAAPKITSNAEQMLKDKGLSYKCIHPPKYHEDFDRKQMKLDGW